MNETTNTFTTAERMSMKLVETHNSSSATFCHRCGIQKTNLTDCDVVITGARTGNRPEYRIVQLCSLCISKMHWYKVPTSKDEEPSYHGLGDASQLIKKQGKQVYFDGWQI